LTEVTSQRTRKGNDLSAHLNCHQQTANSSHPETVNILVCST